jgi:hypothetical protein
MHPTRVHYAPARPLHPQPCEGPPRGTTTRTPPKPCPCNSVQAIAEEEEKRALYDEDIKAMRTVRPSQASRASSRVRVPSIVQSVGRQSLGLPQ